MWRTGRRLVTICNLRSTVAGGVHREVDIDKTRSEFYVRGQTDCFTREEQKLNGAAWLIRLTAMRKPLNNKPIGIHSRDSKKSLRFVASAFKSIDSICIKNVISLSSRLFRGFI